MRQQFSTLFNLLDREERDEAGPGLKALMKMAQFIRVPSGHHTISAALGSVEELAARIEEHAEEMEEALKQGQQWRNPLADEAKHLRSAASTLRRAEDTLSGLAARRLAWARKWVRRAPHGNPNSPPWHYHYTWFVPGQHCADETTQCKRLPVDCGDGFPCFRTHEEVAHQPPVMRGTPPEKAALCLECARSRPEVVFALAELGWRGSLVEPWSDERLEAEGRAHVEGRRQQREKEEAEAQGDEEAEVDED
jgi:hypothetical protein